MGGVGSSSHGTHRGRGNLVGGHHMGGAGRSSHERVWVVITWEVWVGHHMEVFRSSHGRYGNCHT